MRPIASTPTPTPTRTTGFHGQTRQPPLPGLCCDPLSCRCLCRPRFWLGLWAFPFAATKSISIKRTIPHFAQCTESGKRANCDGMRSGEPSHEVARPGSARVRAGSLFLENSPKIIRNEQKNQSMFIRLNLCRCWFRCRLGSDEEPQEHPKMRLGAYGHLGPFRRSVSLRSAS